MGTVGFLPGTKRSGSEADRSPLSNVENKWSYSSVHPTHLKGKHRDNFTFVMLPDAQGLHRVHLVAYAISRGLRYISCI